MRKRSPELSIVIITLNEEKNLDELLKSIRRQNYKDYEVIISDAGSKDRTREIARKAGCQVVNGGLPARGRNLGARNARGEFIIFIDADVILPEKFLDNVIEQIKREDADIASVSLKPLTKSKLEKFLHKGYNLWQKITTRIDPHAAGCCIVVKRKIFKKIGGFEEDIKFAEDHAFARKAFRRGAKYKVLDAEIFVSVRRLKKEGSAVIVIKYILAALHRAFIGEIRNDLFKYNLKR